MEPIKIIDIIHHKNKYGIQVFHILNRMPKFLYERDGNWLIAEDHGFFRFYKYETPSKAFQAFAGREFKIPMVDGSTINANGQWWDDVKPDYQELLTRISVGTPEILNKCNVFIGGIWVDPQIIRHTINPSNNYNKYDTRHPDAGKHIIKSRW